MMTEMKFCRSVLWELLVLIIITTGSESAHPVVKVKYNGTAVLPCSWRCSGVVRWTLYSKSSEVLAECDQTSCRSVKEGYQMIHNQYLQGDLSLIITEADFSKRALYTCNCNGTDLCDVQLQVEARRTSVLMKSGGSLVMELEVSDPVEVIYNSTGSANGSSGQICTVDGGSLQSKPEYTNRTSLSSSAALELRDMEESDSGVYTVRTIRNTEDIHIYTVTVTGPGSNGGGAGDLLWMLIVPVVLVLVILVGIVWQRRRIQQLWINQFVEKSKAVTEEVLKTGDHRPSDNQ